jgi:hypothetical protein
VQVRAALARTTTAVANGETYYLTSFATKAGERYDVTAQ